MVNKIISGGKSLFLCLLLLNSTACWAENQTAETTSEYQVVDLKVLQIDVAPLGLADCTTTVALAVNRVLAACRSARTDTEEDYGLRLYILATDGPQPAILSSTRGLGDAYTVTLQLRRNAGGTIPDLLLADAAAEYAYGTAVYHLTGDKLVYLGEIGYVQMSADNNPVSALGITRIQSTREGFKVSFLEKVYSLDKSGEYKPVDARKASITFDGKRLR
ncbi:MAG TPA: hypothetical protein VIM41_05705 [Gammaproteobacteria bacterium]